jgi:hypothetical protein
VFSVSIVHLQCIDLAQLDLVLRPEPQIRGNQVPKEWGTELGFSITAVYVTQKIQGNQGPKEMGTELGCYGRIPKSAETKSQKNGGRNSESQIPKCSDVCGASHAKARKYAINNFNSAKCIPLSEITLFSMAKSRGRLLMCFQTLTGEKIQRGSLPPCQSVAACSATTWTFTSTT